MALNLQTFQVTSVIYGHPVVEDVEAMSAAQASAIGSDRFQHRVLAGTPVSTVKVVASPIPKGH